LLIADYYLLITSLEMSLSIEPTLEADFTFAEDEPFRFGFRRQLAAVTLRYALYGELEQGA